MHCPLRKVKRCISVCVCRKTIQNPLRFAGLMQGFEKILLTCITFFSLGGDDRPLKTDFI